MTRRLKAYVALGDSFTGGFDPAHRWPDGVAAALGPGARYANLAEVGATSRDVEEHQLTPALAMRPDLVSLICGANDVLESVRPDADAYAERLGRMFGRIRAERPGAAVFTVTYPDLSHFVELRPHTRARVSRGVERFNAACRELAAEHGVLCLEGAGHPGARDPRNIAPDGFHPSPEGHRRATAEVVRALEDWLGTRLRPKEEAA